MKYILILVALLIAAQAQACNPDSLRADWQTAGDLFQQPRDGRWCRWITVDIICGAHGGLIDARNYPIRWDDWPAEQEAKCQQQADDLLRSHVLQTVDWTTKIDKATAMITDDDLKPSLSALILAIQALEDPDVGELANAWRTIAGELTWVQTTEQADSLLYRIADSFGMSGVGMLNYIKANQDRLE